MPKTNAYSRDNYLTTESAVDFNLARLNQYVLTTSDVLFNSIGLIEGLSVGGNVHIGGNLEVTGATTIISTNVVDISDNIIVINSGNTGAGVVVGGGLSGIEVDRGTLTNYQSVFAESDQTFKIGQVGSLQTVATREDIPLNYGIMVYNPSSFRLDSVSNVVIPITFSSNTASTSSSTGTVKIVGGLGITGAINTDNKYAMLGTDYNNYISSNGSNNFVVNSPQNVVFSMVSGKTIQVPTGVNMTFGSLTNSISSTGSDLVLASSSFISLNATSNVGIPLNIPLQWNAGNNITSDGTDLTITSGGTISLNGLVSSTNTTASTSVILGAVKLAGGLSINNVSNSVSSSNGGTITSGGGGAFGKDLYIGGTVLIGDISLSTSQVSGQGTNLRSMSRSVVTVSNVDTTFNSFEGGNISTGSTIANAYTLNILGSPTVSGGGSITNSYAMNVASGNSKMAGELILTDTTASTSATVGTIKMSGSIAINNATNSTSIISGGTFSSVGGASIYKDVYLGGKLDIGNIDTAGVTQITGLGVTFRSRSKILTTSSSDNTVFNSFEGGVISTASNITNASTLFVSGSPTITGGGVLTNSYALEIGSGNSIFNGKITINNSTNSTSNVTGSLLLNGGIANTNTADATNYTNGGTFTSSGGGAFAKSLFVGNQLYTGNGVAVHNNLQTTGLNRFSIELKNSESVSNIGSDYAINRYTDLGVLIDSPLVITRSTGVVSVNSSVGSSSGSVGALVLTAGGLSINNSSNSVSTSNGGSFTTIGGASILKDLRIGGDQYITGNLTVTGISSFQKTLINTNDGFLSILGSNAITALVNASSSIATSAGSMTVGSNAGSLILLGYSTVNVSSTTGAVSINAAAASNFTTTTGAITISGIGLNLYANSGPITVTTTSSGSISTGTGGLALNTTDTTTGITIGTVTPNVPVTIGNNSTILLNGDITTSGNLTVLGATTTIDSTVVTINDIAVVVNNAPSGLSDGGLLIHRWQEPNDSFIGDLTTDTAKETGLFQAGSSTPSTLVLGMSSSTTNDYYKGWWIKIGTQMRRIKSYIGSTRTATIYITSDNAGPSPGPPFSDGLNLTTAPSVSDPYSLYDLPYIGLYYSAAAKEVRLTGVPFDPVTGLFQDPTSYVNLHVNSIIIEESFVSIGDATINGRLTVTFTATDAVIFQKSGGGGVVFTTDTTNGLIKVANPVNTVSSNTGILFNQYDTVSAVQTYSNIKSTILGNVPGSLSSKLTFDVQNGGTNAVNYLTLNGNTGFAEFNSNVSSVKILNTSTDSLSLNGGINILSVTDATSTTVGGTFTTAGGIAVAKSAYFGSNINSIATTTVGSSNTLTGTNGTINTNGDVTLYNGTSQTVYFAGNGSAIPSFTTRSLGTKIVLKPVLSGSTVDYAFGIATNELWYSVNNSSSNHSFYTGTTKNVKIDNTGLTVFQAGTGLNLYNGTNTSKIYESSNITRLVPFTSGVSVGFIFRDASDSSDNIRINSSGQLTIGLSSTSGTPGVSGSLLYVNGGSFTDTNTAVSGTASDYRVNTFGQGTLNATNSSVTTTTAVGVYIGGAPIQGTNETISNSHSLELGAGSSLSSGANVTTASSLHIVGAPTGNITNSYAILIDSGNSLINGKITISDTTVLGSSNTVTGSVGSLNTAGDITLTNGTSQTIYFNGSGSAAPSFTTRSTGSKLVLKTSVSGSSADYAIGIDTSSTWYTVPTSSQSHNFYLGTSNRFQIDNTGLLLDSSGTLTPAVIRLTNNNKGVIINGGSSSGSANGSQLELYGNTNTITGDAILSTGTTGTIILNTGLANALTINNSGLVNVALNTETTGTGTGALNIIGGVNIDKSLFVGIALNLNFNQKYTYSGDSSGRLNIQSGTGSIAHRVRSFTFDGDNTDDNINEIYGLGNTGSLVNTEFLKQGFDQTTTSYIISTQKTGTGTVRPLSISTGTNTDQIKLLADSTVSLSSTTSSTSSTVGSLKLAGGISSDCNVNAVSSTNGGGCTLKGGLAVAQDVYIGGNLNITGSISSGLSTPTITTDNLINITGGITVYMNKMILNGAEALLSATFRFTPTAANTITTFEFLVPMTSNFVNIYDTVITSNGYYDDTSPVNLENIAGYAVTGTKNVKMRLTSGTTAINTVMVIARFTVY